VVALDGAISAAIQLNPSGKEQQRTRIRQMISTHELQRLLAEDVPYGDLTTEALGIGGRRATIRFAARSRMVVAAIEAAAALLDLAEVTARLHARSGDRVEPGAPLLTGEGDAGGVLRAWKVSQTLTEIWSGVATATRAVVSAARSERPEVTVACTRKNVPGTKAFAVAAIKAGGAVPHRLGLSETILLFPEHRAILPDGDLAAAARRLRGVAPEKKLVIEVKTVEDGRAAAAAGFDVIQAEKFTPEAIGQLAAAVASLRPRLAIAAAGGIDPDTMPRPSCAQEPMFW
jgi:molybdenum transport protein